MGKLKFLLSVLFLIFSLIFLILFASLHNYLYFILSLLFLIFLLIYSLFIYFLEVKKNHERFKDWEDIAYQIHTSEQDVFKNLPIGIITYDSNYTCTFVNDFCKKEFDFPLLKKPIYTIDLALVSFLESTDEYVDLKIGSKYFRFLNNIKSNILYFFDVTSLEEIKSKKKDNTLALGFIKVDDLLQIDRKYALSDKASLYSQITFSISSYFAKYDTCFEQLDNDNYIVITTRKNLDLMIKDEFSLLDTIRDLAKNLQIHLTISFGIACYSGKTKPLFDRALSALDLAERRGGDQVVINIEGDRLKYFGAKAQKEELNSYVISRLQTQNLKNSITNSSNVLIMGHIMADLDALGAMFAAFTIAKSSINNTFIVLDENLLEKTSKKAYDLYLKDNYSKNIISLDEALEILNDESLLFIVDTQSPEICMFKELVYKAKRISVVDHHRAGEVEFKNPETSYVETSSSSTVELITEMFSFYDLSLKPSDNIATVMLAGLVVDTNNFTFRTGSRTFHAASILKDYGANMINVRKLLRDDLKEESIIANAVCNTEIVLGSYSIILLDEVEKDRTLLAKISERALSIDNVSAAFTIAKMQNGNIAISARSLGDINVQLIMEQFGGGGHLEQAATEIANSDLLTVKNELIATLKDYLTQDEEDKEMDVILLEDVKGKGKKNTIISVPNGYGNFLIKQGLAEVASVLNREKLDENLKEEQAALEKKRLALLLMKEEIEKCVVTVFLKVGKDNRGFGQITTKQISEELKNQYDIDLDKKKIDIPSINTLGSYKGVCNLANDIKAELSIKVIAE